MKEKETEKGKNKKKKGKKRKRKGKTVGIRIHGVDGYRVPNRDPRDRVIRIEMNVNPLNTIPGQNTATRGSESGQIRYRVVACERLARHDPVGCRSLILSFALDRVQESKGDPPLEGGSLRLCGPALNLARTPHRKECLVRGRPNELLIVEPTSPKTRDIACRHVPRRVPKLCHPSLFPRFFFSWFRCCLSSSRLFLRNGFRFD